MKLADTARPAEYTHRTWGRVLLIGCHPHDGACLIIERQETTDPDDDDHVLDTCEASDLELVEGSEWPFLGFTSCERNRDRSRAWGERHGFAEVPEGSGRWFYADGSSVPADVWLAAYDKDHP